MHAHCGLRPIAAQYRVAVLRVMVGHSCMSYDSELESAVQAADAAGAILREAFHNSRVSGHFADHSAEQQILETLSAGFPSYGYRGEELGLVRSLRL